MTKRFCDICEKPASELRELKVHKYIGEPRKVEDESTVQTSIVLTARLSFSNHPTGFGGPPDVCEECVLRMMDELQKHAQKRR